VNRLFLYSGLLFILILIFDAYDRDYNQSDLINIEQNENTTSPSSKQPPQVNAPTKDLPTDIITAPREIAIIENSKLLVKYDSNSGELLYAELKDYSVDLGSKDNIIILDFANKKYSASSDIQVMNLNNTPSYEIVKTAKNKVTLVASNINNIILTKTIKLLDNTHQLSVINTVTNNSNKDINVRNYETISRDNNSQGSIMLPTFTGGAYYDERDKFSKLSFEDIAENTEAVQAKNSWISMIEHYFFSAWLPTANLDKTIYTDYQNSIYTIGSSTGYITLNPGKSISYDSLMFVGPKLQSEISDLTEGLDLTVDYGVLTFLSAPLFWILESINKIFGNWGFSIIALTLLIKAVFFKLSETSYRSMAEMKKLTPRMQALKERYSEDKKKFSEALMRMYKEEKVNPLGGCLPILIQIPVFIALYWVLVESIEIRHAPFIGWIQDLSSADPLFILPIAMGVSMYVQQKLNPAPADPMQQKIFLFLPFIFTALFATFPSGLVLYWLTNNILSIAQQYVINKRIVG
jgi:YidC/Oxa1 family membrane protein insertase